MKKEEAVLAPITTNHPHHHQHHQGRLSPYVIDFVAGGLAGSFSKSLIAPLERVKILFQIRSIHYPYAGIWNTVQSIFEKEGLGGLWKGNWATVVRIFPYAALQFLTFQNAKKVSNLTNYP